VGENLPYRANAFGWAPGVLLRRHGFGQLQVPLFILGDLFLAFGAAARAGDLCSELSWAELDGVPLRKSAVNIRK
jgi:hypothetical protein